MKQLDKGKFLNNKAIYFYCILLLILIFIDIVLTVTISIEAALFISIVPVFIVIANLIIAIQMNNNIIMLRKLNLYDKMIDEFPRECVNKEYVITDNFAYAFRRHLCIPIERIEKIECGFNRCINNGSKDKAWLYVLTDDDMKFYFLYYNGFINERKIDVVKQCIVEIVKQKPTILVNGKKLIM